MTPPTETAAHRDRSEPFIGVALVLAWLLACGGLALLAAEHQDARAAALYTRSLPCPAGTRQAPAGTEPASAAQAAALTCRQGVNVTVGDTSPPVMLPDHITVTVDGLPVRVEPASSDDAQLLIGIAPGAHLQAVRWRGLLTELSSPQGTVRTVDDPAATVAEDRLGVAALLGLSAVLTMVALGPALRRLGTQLGRGVTRLSGRPRAVPAQFPQAEAATNPGIPLRRAG
ncbi:MAG: hypothetical protein NVSMB29_02590 [Candidatus Dormibacteria bacterium]